MQVFEGAFILAIFENKDTSKSIGILLQMHHSVHFAEAVAAA